MYSGRFVFSQLMEFFPLPAFRRCVQRYRGHYKVQRFSCLDQFLCMAFAQLTGREPCFHGPAFVSAKPRSSCTP